MGCFDHRDDPGAEGMLALEELPMPTEKTTALAAMFDDLTQRCIGCIDSVTVPIFCVQDEEVRHDRTGVLYRIADHRFLLTASHALREIVQRHALE